MRVRHGYWFESALILPGSIGCLRSPSGGPTMYQLLCLLHLGTGVGTRCLRFLICRQTATNYWAGFPLHGYERASMQRSRERTRLVEGGDRR